jgi:hypothetical protein
MYECLLNVIGKDRGAVIQIMPVQAIPAGVLKESRKYWGDD